MKVKSYMAQNRVPAIGERVLVKTKNLTAVLPVDRASPAFAFFEHEDGGLWQVALKDIFPVAKHAKNPDAELEEAHRIYEETHWGDPPAGVKRVPPSERKSPRIGTAMGQIAKIIYRTTKAGEDAYYEHDFKRKLPVLVFGRPPGSKKNRLYFVGGDYDVDAHGIRG